MVPKASEYQPKAYGAGRVRHEEGQENGSKAMVKGYCLHGPRAPL
jgi:hypothetical protein